MKTILFFGVIFLLSPLSFMLAAEGTMDNQNRIDLNGKWEFHQAGTEKWQPATVPGTVHTDLLANKMIDDPFYRANEHKLQWIDKKDWEYRRSFQITAQQLKSDHLELTFDGLDTYADVYVNGQKVIMADNMFRTWRAECKDILKAGENTLRVYFHSPVTTDLPKLKALGYQLPASNDQSENGELGDKKISIFARKAPYHYGWDWGPRFVTSGVWRPVYIRMWNDAIIRSTQIIQKEVDKSLAKIRAVLEVESSVAEKAKVSAKVVGQTFSAGAQLQTGMNKIFLDFTINNPQLWWPNGLGEAHLYTLNLALDANNKTMDQKDVSFGVRTLRLVRELSGNGKSFYFEINGVPVFAKGANYIPNDNFLPRVTPERYEHVIRSAAEANMNMLRVWGGGIYENDIFYNLCDKYGIMVWQDFMFACSMYPGDSTFVDNVRHEIIENIKRLRNHPSIVLWCGNNEIDVAWSHNTHGGWGWKERFSEEQRTKIWGDYDKIFHHILPELVKKYDGSRSYWPSSPLTDWGVRSSYSSTSGDMHYWGVWHGQEPFANFEKHIGRFMSEYGFQSFPEFKSVKQYTIPEDWDIASPVMLSHQRSPIGNERILKYMSWYYNTPDEFDEILYVGQVLQAEGIRSGMEAHRRHKPYCMGTLYWQINDCWPVASWSGMDYYGRWKALHYFAKKAYAPLLVSPWRTGDSLHVYIVWDKLNDLDVTLEFSILDFTGKQLENISRKVHVPANSSASYLEEKINDILGDADSTSVFGLATVMQNGKTLAQNVIYFSTVKDLQLPQVKIKPRIEKTNDGYRIYLKSAQLAKNVYLTHEMKGFFSDNYFDLLPGRETAIDFKTKDSRADFAGGLKIESLRDTY